MKLSLGGEHSHPHDHHNDNDNANGHMHVGESHSHSLKDLSIGLSVLGVTLKIFFWRWTEFCYLKVRLYCGMKLMFP